MKPAFVLWDIKENIARRVCFMQMLYTIMNICLIFYIFHKIMPFEQRFNFLDLNDVNKIVKSLH